MSSPKLVDFTYDLYQTFALSQPAIRSVVMILERDDEGDVTHCVHPVVSLAGFTSTRYIKEGSEDSPPRTQVTHEALLNDRWRVKKNGVSVKAVIANAVDGNLEPIETSISADRCVHYVACQWPAEEDAQRFAELAVALEQRMDAIAAPAVSADESTVAAPLLDGDDDAPKAAASTGSRGINRLRRFHFGNPDSSTNNAVSSDDDSRSVETLSASGKA